MARPVYTVTASRSTYTVTASRPTYAVEPWPAATPAPVVTGSGQLQLSGSVAAVRRRFAAGADSLALTGTAAGLRRRFASGGGDLALSGTCNAVTGAATYFTVTKTGQAVSAGSNQYFPSLVDMRSHSTFPYDWALYTSTDHTSGSGGIYLWVANGDPSNPANWKSYNSALAEGGFDSYGTKPAANPIFVDTTEPASPPSGTWQCETPCVNLIGDVAYMSYHNYGFGTSLGSAVQKTMLATAPDGLNFTRYTAHTGGTSAVILEPNVSIASGVHTGYFRWGPNPFSGIAYTYWGVSLWYDTDNSHNMTWGSNDGITWTRLEVSNKNRFMSGVFGTGNAVGTPFWQVVRDLGDGTYAAIVSAGEITSGTGVGAGKLYEVITNDTGDIISDARLVLDVGASTTFEDTRVVLPGMVDYNGQLVMVYQGIDSTGLDKLGLATVAYTASATALSDRTPSLSFDTEYTQDFRGASALISNFAHRTSSGGSATFSASGLTIATAAGATRSVGLATAIDPADYEMIEIMVTGFAASPTILISIQDGALGPADEGVYMLTGSSTSYLAGLRTRHAAASTFSDNTVSMTRVGQTTKFSGGMRYFPQLGIAQYLGHDRYQVVYEWHCSAATPATVIPAFILNAQSSSILIEGMTIRLRAVTP